MGKKWTADEMAAKLVVHAIGASGFGCVTLTALNNGLSVTGVSLLTFAILIEREVNERRVRRLNRPYVLRDQTPKLASLVAQLRARDHVVIAHFYMKGHKEVFSAIVGAKDPKRAQEPLSIQERVQDLQKVLKRVDNNQIILLAVPKSSCCDPCARRRGHSRHKLRVILSRVLHFSYKYDINISSELARVAPLLFIPKNQGTPPLIRLSTNHTRSLLMYGQGGLPTGIVTTTTGVAVLPSTGGTRPLFIAALAVTAVGVITIATSVVVAFKQRTQA